MNGYLQTWMDMPTSARKPSSDRCLTSEEQQLAWHFGVKYNKENQNESKDVSMDAE